MNLSCGYCGNYFSTPFNRKLYCDDRCKERAKRKRQNPDYEPRPPEASLIQPGDVFERLTVQEKAGSSGNHSTWLCVCSCGLKIVARGDKLRSGRIKSCGCLYQEMQDKLRAEGIDRAKTRLSELTKSEIKCINCSKIFKKEDLSVSNRCLDCESRIERNRFIRTESIRDPYCFSQIQSVLKRENTPSVDLLWRKAFYLALTKDDECHYCWGSLSKKGHSLDRMNNNLGHLCYNVVPCCHHCNLIKGSRFTYKDMMRIAPVLREMQLRRFLSLHF